MLAEAATPSGRWSWASGCWPAGIPGVRLALAEVAAEAARWDVAAGGLTAVPDTDDPQARVLAARLAHARGRPDEAHEMAEAALSTAEERNQWSVACQALEVMGRAARIDRCGGGPGRVPAAERLAIEHDLPLDRVSALHELGTVDLLLDGSTGRLERARAMAVDAGVLGPGRQARRADRGQAVAPRRGPALAHAGAALSGPAGCGWTGCGRRRVYFQAVAHAHRRKAQAMERCVAGRRSRWPRTTWTSTPASGARSGRTRRCWPTTGTGWRSAWTRRSNYLRRSPTTAPAPTSGCGRWCARWTTGTGRTAASEARPSSVNWENAALLGYADAVEAGRRGGRRDAERLLAAADTALADLPWWRHRVRLLVADAALTGGWGDPIGWAREALPVFAGRGDSRLASRCRELLRRAGAPVPRPGRGDTAVPPALR